MLKANECVCALGTKTVEAGGKLVASTAEVRRRTKRESGAAIRAD